MHLLIFCRQEFKIRNPADVNTFICARWPDVSAEPLLFDTVKCCMVHGSCGVLNPAAPCVENGRCTKGFPKAFQDHTSMDDGGYSLYCRPNDGVTVEV
jgi:hypothetical protein